jgi:hypothetical protein
MKCTAKCYHAEFLSDVQNDPRAEERGLFWNQSVHWFILGVPREKKTGKTDRH